MIDLKDKVFLITGAASGMGAAASRILAEEGAKLVLFDIDQVSLSKLAAELSTSDLLAERVDVADRAGVMVAVQKAAERFGRIDIAIHFAGILATQGLDEIDETTLRSVLDVNLAGSLWVAQAVSLVMRQQDSGGSIVLTASDSARHGSITSGPAYAVSKGGVIALTRSLALLLGKYRIRVNAICPGLALTEMSKSWDKQIIDDYSARSPLGRLGSADDMAKAAICLGSEALAYVNGEVLEVNGGYYFD